MGSALPLGVQPTVLAPCSPRDPIGERIGSYRIVGALGKGGCGSVWLAEHEVIGTKVAIKILRPEVVNIPGVHERFITEARAASTIPSPHIARYIDLGQLPTGEPYAIMEYLAGETLHARIKRQQRLPVADAIAIARQAATTLALAHEASIIHRDIKPENIFVVGDDARIDIKVLDFGIAKLIGDAMQSGHQTADGVFVGTPAYCAPEQLCGAPASTAVDVYALGATLYEMLVGTLPYDLAAPDFLAQKVSDIAPRVRAARSDVPEWLDGLVASMLAMNPLERPASMRAVVAALDGEAGASAAIEPPRARVWMLAVGLVAVIAVVLAVVAASGRDRAPARPPPVKSLTVTPIAVDAAVPLIAPADAPAAVTTEAVAPTTTTTTPSPPPRRPAKRSTSSKANTPAPANRDVILADPFEE